MGSFISKFGLFFTGASQSVSRVETKLNTSVPAAGCQQHTEMLDEGKHTLEVGSAQPQKRLLMPWAKGGRVMWSETVLGTTDTVFPRSQVA